MTDRVPPTRPPSPLTDAFFKEHGNGPERYGIINGTEVDAGYQTVKDQKFAGTPISPELQAELDALEKYQNAVFDYNRGADWAPASTTPSATPLIPSGHSQVEVPPEYIPYIPPGTILAKHDEAGTFAAVVPRPNGEHHFFTEVGESLHKFLMRIAAVFGHKEHP